MNTPFINLFDAVGIGFLSFLGALFLWLLGAIEFGAVVAIFLFFLGAVWFAKQG